MQKTTKDLLEEEAWLEELNFLIGLYSISKDERDATHLLHAAASMVNVKDGTDTFNLKIRKLFQAGLDEVAQKRCLGLWAAELHDFFAKGIYEANFRAVMFPD